MDFTDEDYKKVLINDILYRFDYAVSGRVELENVAIVRLWNRKSSDIKDQPANNLYVIDKNTRNVWNMKEILGDNPYFGNIYLKTHPEGRTHFYYPEYPTQFYKAKVIASDCLGYFHTIDIDTMTRVALNRYRLDSNDHPSEINAQIAEEVDGYTIILIDHICTANQAKLMDNKIYAIDQHGNILWNIKDIISNWDDAYLWFEVINSSTEVPYLITYDYTGNTTTINLRTKEIVRKVWRRR
jgi:hypothetical protein